MIARWTVKQIIFDQPEGWIEPTPEHGRDAEVVAVRRRMVIEVTCESAHRFDLYRDPPSLVEPIKEGSELALE